MNRWPVVASFILFIVLCASGAYWAMQLFKPPVRPVAAAPRAAKAEVNTEAAAGLFGGGKSKAEIASNYQLQGVIMSGTARDSVAILSADGKPSQAVRVDMEVLPGVTVKEVHREYVLLSEGGATKRVELPEGAAMQSSPAISSPVPVQPAPAQGPSAQRPSAQRPPVQRPPVQRPPVQRAVPPTPPAVASPPPQTPQPMQPGMPGAAPPAAARPGYAGPPAGTAGGGPGTQMINPPPSPEPMPANPPASPEPVPGGLPPRGSMPAQ